jgi:hypothetical protein
MAFAAANLTAEPRSFSAGPCKLQLLTWSVASGDTSGTITCDSLSRVDQVYLSGGLTLTAAPTYSGNAITLAFVDPVATRYGTALVFGK